MTHGIGKEGMALNAGVGLSGQTDPRPIWILMNWNWTWNSADKEKLKWNGRNGHGGSRWTMDGQWNGPDMHWNARPLDDTPVQEGDFFREKRMKA